MKTAQKISPRKVKSTKQLCRMARDNIDIDDHWILNGMDTVTIARQKVGEPAVAAITIPRATFNKLVDWYMRPQPVKSCPQQGPEQ